MSRPPGLTIRRAEPGDFAELARTFEDESTYSGTLQLPFPSRELWRKRLAEPKPNEFLLLALLDGEIAGNAGLMQPNNSPRRSHAMHLGIAVRSDYQGRGVGNALMEAMIDVADNWLNVTRIELTVFTDNERAIALYRRHGFEMEGTHKAYALRAGAYADVHAMARVRFK
ncbi:MAG: GNAT family N-acetyltransferase [Gemmatimonadales bacterium]